MIKVDIETLICSKMELCWYVGVRNGWIKERRNKGLSYSVQVHLASGLKLERGTSAFQIQH